jgi:tetratricopeptide (TPR) repeat protein
VGATVMDQVDRLRAALADRYELDREIGHGGMAHVYRAHDRQHGRDVAIKVLRPDLAAALGPERFLREIHLEARLQHPHILPLYDSGTADGFLYYVMPYVAGETLRERIRREKQLPLADALRITKDVADALSYAHDHGVIHRDIKPGNILLSGEHALVADFGIAKAISAADEEALTGTGIAVGTPEYMSPEQGSGDQGVDRRSDIYALGCVLYEMLAGQPPFTGRTVQSVLARHRHDPPPSLRVVRPVLHPEIEEVIEKALAKVPADRFATVAAFLQALEASSVSQPNTRGETPRAPKWRGAILAAALAALAALAGIGIWRLAVGGSERTDPNKVMVFPLIDRIAESRELGAGEEVAIMIGSGLEHTEPLKWIDGWAWMDSAQRENPRLLTARSARALSQRQRARFYIDGSIVGAGDSATVVLRLNDARTDSLLLQASASGSSDPTLLPQLGLRAMIELLPVLVEPGRRVDHTAVSALTDRRPAAVAAWLQGEREYRRSQFALALDYFRRAVAMDSGLALAALRGAEAASWLDRDSEADQLARVALEQLGTMPAKYAHFARGLAAYYAGAGDSAAAEFGRAIALDSTWSAAWGALGEVHYHLVPGGLFQVSSAEAAFEAAYGIDPTFTPPLFHLTELALRRDDLKGAERLAREFLRTEPDSARTASITLMLDCARGDPGSFDWSRPARRHVSQVIAAARWLSVAAAHPACAEGAYRAVLTSDTATVANRWNATLGLQSLLLARGERGQAKAVLDSAVAGGILEALGLLVVDAVAGAGMLAEAGEVIQSLAGEYRGMSTARLWYLGIWAFHQKETDLLDTIVRTMVENGRRGRDPDSLLTGALEARVALLLGDSAGALSRLGRLRTTASRVDVGWGLWESLGSERLLLAELLMATGKNAEALRVADGFDHAQSAIYLLYLPRSLALRARAASNLGKPRLTEKFRQRLLALGRKDLLETVP